MESNPKRKLPPHTEDLVIRGGKPLSGEISVQHSKNGSVALICAALLNRGVTLLRGIARIEEVNRLIEIVRSIGVAVEWQGERTLRIEPPAEFSMATLDRAAAARVRSSLMLVGPLAHRLRSFALPHAGGCKLGKRPVEPHWYALAALGIDALADDDCYRISVGHWRHGADIVMGEASDTATINAVLAAALVPAETAIRFGSWNYQVQEVRFFLERLGVTFEDVGPATVIVRGVERIERSVEYENSEDPIDAMMLVSAAVTTRSGLVIRRVPIDFMRLELQQLERMQLHIDVSGEYRAANGRTALADVTVTPSDPVAPVLEIQPRPYPGLNADNLPFFFPIATQAYGRTMIHDWMFQKRALDMMDGLTRLGADMELLDVHRVYVRGRTPLRARQLVAPDALRPATVMVIAMLAAEGTSILRGVYQVNRGYERIADRLRDLGADIEVLPAGR